MPKHRVADIDLRLDDSVFERQRKGQWNTSTKGSERLRAGARDMATLR